ncbi:putative serine/threonine-protein kinase SIK1B [Peromyscus californicus insignis]|uniref:putative serine/threonine-protein kinase SIK1B n=1 Tax=Peromyscus californicus insignis TaxID=564181 RepID=UPI0022A7EDA1|nr:putative serine/threonine-protein kinase SIK1B [Peromyscus californicus insignis]
MDSHPNTKSLNSQYMVLYNIGHRAFGSVQLAYHRLTGIPVAVKVIENLEEDLRFIVSEMMALEKLHHPNIIHLFQGTGNTRANLLHHGVCQGRRLVPKSDRGGQAAGGETQKIFRQILSAIKYCHDLDIVHRELKPENILLDEEGILKLADFGLTTKYRAGTQLQRQCGTKTFNAPEQILGLGYDGKKTDVWILGGLLYFISTGNHPFQGDTMEEIQRKIDTGTYDIPAHSEDREDGDGEDQVRMLNEDQVRMLNEDQVRMLKEDQVRMLNEDQVRMLKEDQVRMLKEDQVRMLKEDQVRMLKEDQVRMLNEDQVRMLKEDQVRMLKEDQVRMLNEDQVRMLKEDQVRMLKEDQVRMLNEDREDGDGEDQVRMLNEDQVRMLNEDQVRMLNEDQVRMLNEDQVRMLKEDQVRMLNEDQVRMLKEDQVRMLKEDQVRMLNEDQVRMLNEDQVRMLKEDQVRMLKEDQVSM